MFCSKCGHHGDEGEKYCRKCGIDLENAPFASRRQNRVQRKGFGEELTRAGSKDPDELAGNGIGSVFMGDGFFMVAVILSATESSVSSLLWLFLLIPAFFFFGKGFADVFQARQIRLRMKQNEIVSPPVIDVFKNHNSGGLITTPSVTERTTRQLK